MKLKELITLGLILIVAKGVINSMDPNPRLYAPMSPRSSGGATHARIDRKELIEEIKTKDQDIRTLDEHIARTRDRSEKNRIAAKRTQLQEERDKLQYRLTELKNSSS